MNYEYFDANTCVFLDKYDFEFRTLTIFTLWIRRVLQEVLQLRLLQRGLHQGPVHRRQNLIPGEDLSASSTS